MKKPLVLKHRPHPGFTLIELLVVIAIISLLAAILFPVFGRARDNARRSSCQSNARQIGFALVQYSQDYDEKYPAMYHGGLGYWNFIIQPYIKNTQIFDCPSVRGKWSGANNTYNLGYGLNTWLFEERGYVSNPAPVSAALIAKPTETVFLADAVSSPRSNPVGFAWPGGAYNTINQWPPYRHLETTVVLFADGHVKAMRKGPLEARATSEDGRALTGDAQFLLWNEF